MVVHNPTNLLPSPGRPLRILDNIILIKLHIVQRIRLPLLRTHELRVLSHLLRHILKLVLSQLYVHHILPILLLLLLPLINIILTIIIIMFVISIIILIIIIMSLRSSMEPISSFRQSGPRFLLGIPFDILFLQEFLRLLLRLKLRLKFPHRLLLRTKSIIHNITIIIIIRIIQ